MSIPAPENLDQLIDLASMGVPSFDQDVKDLIEDLGETFCFGVWEEIFGLGGSRRFAANVTIRNYIDDHMTVNKLLLIYLWATGLTGNPPNGVNSNLSDYNSYCNDLATEAGVRLYGVLTRRDQARRNFTLVANYPVNRQSVGQSKIVIKVDGPTYNAFLKDGGTPDVIMGAMVSDQERGYSALVEKKDAYTNAWERKRRVLMQTQSLKRFSHAVDGLKLAMHHQVKNQSDDHPALTHDQLMERMRKQVKCLDKNWHENLYVNIRKVVCKTFFEHTMGLQILEATDRVSEEHPHIDVRECVFLASLDLVGVWVAKLMKLQTSPAPK